MGHFAKLLALPQCESQRQQYLEKCLTSVDNVQTLEMIKKILGSHSTTSSVRFSLHPTHAGTPRTPFGEVLSCYAQGFFFVVMEQQLTHVFQKLFLLQRRRDKLLLKI